MSRIMSQIYISAAHKSSGKTTISIGLCAALTKKGLNIQPFKKGPDYIDPLWLTQASANACYNLDFYTTPADQIARAFTLQKANCDLAVIEGNKGLFDGMDLHGSDSNAAMARLLDTPVVLVINTNGITRGVAPLLLGYQSFDPSLNISGVILNNIAGQRHEAKLIAVVEEYTDIRVIGAVRRNNQLKIDERHLGLIPSNEKTESDAVIQRISNIVEEQVDLDSFLQLSGVHQEQAIGEAAPLNLKQSETDLTIKIGIFKDAAFGFYYPDDLQVLQKQGAELIAIDAINDVQLPDVDALFIGGGFPETHMQQLSDNTAMRNAVTEYIENDGIAYAECGGLMYLSRSLTWGDKNCKMCGIIPADTRMFEKPQGRGYIKLRETGKMPWPCAGQPGAEIYAHEFHYSRLENLPDNVDYAFKVLRGVGIDGQHDGFIYKNLLANYAHMRNVGNNHWAERLIAHIQAVKKHSTEVK